MAATRTGDSDERAGEAEISLDLEGEVGAQGIEGAMRQIDDPAQEKISDRPRAISR